MSIMKKKAKELWAKAKEEVGFDTVEIEILTLIMIQVKELVNLYNQN